MADSLPAVLSAAQGAQLLGKATRIPGCCCSCQARILLRCGDSVAPLGCGLAFSAGLFTPLLWLELPVGVLDTNDINIAWETVPILVS